MLPTPVAPAQEPSPEQGDDLMFALAAEEGAGCDAATHDAATRDGAIRDGEPTMLGLVELLLKSPATVDRLNRDPWRQRELFPRLLFIALTSYLVYASLMVLILNLAPAAHNELIELPRASWGDGSAWALPLAYAAGIVLAACVCLPSFYFYGLL